MERFENVLIRGTHASRYVMSYIWSGGEINARKFRQWLEALPGNLSEEEIDHLYDIFLNGKMELEANAREFLKNYSK